MYRDSMAIYPTILTHMMNVSWLKWLKKFREIIFLISYFYEYPGIVYMLVIHFFHSAFSVITSLSIINFSLNAYNVCIEFLIA